MSITDFLKNVNAILKKSSEYTPEILKFLKEFYGETPKVYEIMAKYNQDVVLAQFIKNQSIIKENKSKLPLKMKELIALSAAVALGCEYCQEVHMKAALQVGATKDQIFETILISSMIAESSKMAVSLRELEKIK
ncbi:MAG: carboxymuconolactone decarboxylase family protein [Candidatus Helarchaeota archaeon]|nr:carboxymuconolactone decarboxylase family protein [Candidatus Helarchaeota archaeon]